MNELDPKNKQQIFDFVFEKINEQGRTSSNEDGGCEYRGSDGRKCAIGHLMRDDEYHDYYEGIGICYDNFQNPVARWAGDKGFDLEFLSSLQDAHDSIIIRDHGRRDMEQWKTKMTSVALKYGLEAPK